MTKYRGFFLKNSSQQSERKEWSGGHSSEGTGVYDNIYTTNIINTKTGKEAYGGVNEKEAMRAIDIHLDKKKEIKNIEKKCIKINTKINTLTTKKDNLMRKLEQEIRNLRKEESELHNSEFNALRFY